MAFTNDESVLKGINLDMIQQYYDSINQLRPILLDESGYVEKTREISFEDALKKAPKAVQDNYNEYGRLLKSRSEILNQIDSGTRQGSVDGASFYVGPNGQIVVEEAGFGKGVFSRDTFNQNLMDLKSQQDDLVRGITTTEKYLDKTDEKKSLEQRFKALESAQLSALEEQLSYLNSPEYKGQVSKQRELERKQQDIAAAQADRRAKALAGEIGVSDVLGKRLQDEFTQFKESQARAGNIILGDTLEEAVGKGTASNQALERFKNNADMRIQAERDAIIQGETPFFFQDLATSGANTYGAGNVSPGSFVGGAYNFASGAPGMPNYLAGSQGALSGLQPYQFDAQLQLQRDMFNAQRRGGSSGRSGLIGGLAGAGLGAAFAAPTGGMSMLAGAQLGGLFGSGAGTIFE